MTAPFLSSPPVGRGTAEGGGRVPPRAASSSSADPSTILRMVPLPICDGEDQRS